MSVAPAPPTPKLGRGVDEAEAAHGHARGALLCAGREVEPREVDPPPRHVVARAVENLPRAGPLDLDRRERRRFERVERVARGDAAQDLVHRVEQLLHQHERAVEVAWRRLEQREAAQVEGSDEARGRRAVAGQAEQIVRVSDRARNRG
eukprot:7386748-Prymnesium_polylepis.2